MAGGHRRTTIRGCDYVVRTETAPRNLHIHLVEIDLAAPVADSNHLAEKVSVGNAIAGSAQIITNGVKTIPPYHG